MAVATHVHCAFKLFVIGYTYLTHNNLVETQNINHCGLVGNTLSEEHRGAGFDLRYRQKHSVLECLFKLLIPCHWVQWQTKEPQGH